MYKLYGHVCFFHYLTVNSCRGLTLSLVTNFAMERRAPNISQESVWGLYSNIVMLNRFKSMFEDNIDFHASGMSELHINRSAASNKNYVSFLLVSYNATKLTFSYVFSRHQH